MMTTCTQAQAEDQVLAALSSVTGRIYPWDQISDAVDVYLCRIEREQGRPLDRSSLPQAVVLTVLDTIVRAERADA